MYVQFTDSTKATIQSVFSCAQDSVDYPNQGIVDVTDSRYLAFINPTPTVAHQAAMLLSTGLSIVSTSTPAINGTYAVDQLSQMDVIAVETSLSAGKGFPGGVTTFNYPDAAGTMHAFSETNFTNLAAAVRDFVYGCKSVIAAASTVLPASSTTIA